MSEQEEYNIPGLETQTNRVIPRLASGAVLAGVTAVKVTLQWPPKRIGSKRMGPLLHCR